MALDWCVENGFVVRYPNSLYLMLIILQLYFDWYCLLMVAVLDALTCNWCGLVGVTLCNMMIMALSALLESIMMTCAVDLCEVWAHLPASELILKYLFFLCILGDHVRQWLCAYMCSFRCWCMIVPTRLYELWLLYWWW